jgi:hypothetical protein
MTMTPEPFLSAEIEYRQQRITYLSSFGSHRGRGAPPPPTLKLPHTRRRPVAVA